MAAGSAGWGRNYISKDAKPKRTRAGGDDVSECCGKRVPAMIAVTLKVSMANRAEICVKQPK